MRTALRRSVVLVVAAAATACGRSGSEAPTDVPPAPPPMPESAPPVTAAGPRGEIPPDARAPADPPKKAPDAPPTPTPAPAAEPAAPPAAPPAPADQSAAEAPKPAPSRPPVPPQIREAIAAARAKAAKGDGPGAISDLRDLEQLAGENADLRIEQGRIYLALAEEALARGEDSFLVKGFVADAHVRWKQATALDPTVPGAAALRARVLRFEENPGAAREVLDAHLASHPDDAEAHAVLGEMATAGRDWQRADDHWTRAAILDPSNGKARLQATIAKQWMRVPAPQLETGYLEAARLLPDDGEPIRLLSLLARSRDERLALLRKVVEGNPKAVTARLWIAHVLRTEGAPDLDGARKALDEALALAPANPDAHFNLGLVHEQSGAKLDALRSFLACVENSAPGNCGVASDRIDRTLHDPATGAGRDVPLSLRIRAMDAVCAKNPTEGRYGNNAGLWFRDVGRDYEQSLRYYLKSCEAAPDDQDFLNDTGLIYQFHLTDRAAECMKYYDRVVALVEEEGQEPIRGYWDTLENLCKWWFENGDFAKVVEIAKKRANPDATVNGAPYPSLRAAQHGAAAAKKLAERK